MNETKVGSIHLNIVNPVKIKFCPPDFVMRQKNNNVKKNIKFIFVFILLKTKFTKLRRKAALTSRNAFYKLESQKIFIQIFYSTV